MTNYLKRLFILPAKVENLREEQRNAAQLLGLDHRAQAEHHMALAEMYEKRVARLEQST